MPRIIAGRYRGARLVVPPGDHTRPTRDRVRESLFNVLQVRLRAPGLRVLDLFAGAGTLGLEALSRGAARAVLVERDAAALKALRQNATRFGADAQVVGKPVARYLGGPATPFDLVFMDPPYADGAEAPTLASLLAGGWLAPESLVIVEHPVERRLTAPAGLTITRTLTYGVTGLTLLSPTPRAPTPPAAPRAADPDRRPE